MPTSRSNNKIIGISIGDPGGIGPEVILKSFQSEYLQRHLTAQRGANVFFVCFGSMAVLERNRVIARSTVQLNAISDIKDPLLKPSVLNVLDISDTAEEYAVGKIAEQNARLALKAVERAARYAKEGLIDALVTAPINKEACQMIRPKFCGHTELLAEIDQTPRFAMMLCGEMLRVVLVTTHIPLKDVAGAISQEAIVEKIILAHEYLKDRVKINDPRIGVAGLNPHAGEGGKIGREEEEMIIPAVAQARSKGISVAGVYPPDVIFHKAYCGELDAIIAMYHDVGLAPLKMIAFESGINVTLGLSFVRTSPDHGTAFDIAYKNKAHETSMCNAIIHALSLLK
ncbi:MAG: 4-hydroxythreonine-4-phosphate dehydrogenase PdxA [Candidatus Omnitrophica bacterium]|nr:4-hydroxythreonine-4-phosphate dehydrogenase PdxA [Candidatus Omnitrophota bacterium]